MTKKKSIGGKFRDGRLEVGAEPASHWNVGLMKWAFIRGFELRTVMMTYLTI